MNKILTEWRKFLKESSLQDDILTAQKLAFAIDNTHVASDQTNNWLRANKKRAQRIVEDYLQGDRSVFEVFPTEDAVRVGNKNYFFPKKDFDARMYTALEILTDPNLEIDFSQFNALEKISDIEKPGKYGVKDHGGGASDVGLALPTKAFELEDRTKLDANIEKWVNFHKALFSGNQVDIYKSSKDVKPAIVYFLDLYRAHAPFDEKYMEALLQLLEHVSNVTEPEPARSPEKSEYEIAMAEVESLKGTIEKLMALARKRPKSPAEKKSIDQAKKDLPAKQGELRDKKRAMRSLSRGRSGR